MSCSLAPHCGMKTCCFNRLALWCVAWCLGPVATAWAVESGVADSKVKDSAKTFKLMTFNIRYDNYRDGKDAWKHRSDAVVKLLSTQDLIGLQEVTAGQLKALVARLPEFDFHGVGRDDGRSRGEHAAIAVRRTRFVVLEWGTFWLSEDPERVGVAGWDAALPRTCTWMLVKDRACGDRLWVANTHFDHRGSNARLESARLIRRVVSDQPAGIPCVVMGDFNCLPGSLPHKVMVGDQVLEDARSLSRRKVAGPESTWNGFRGIVSGRIIDHIFVRGPLDIEALSTLDPKTSGGRYASDHLPVKAVVSWPESDVIEN